MISILKWLHRNEFLVHVAVGILVFYGIPILFSALAYPHLLEMLVSTAIATILIISLGAFSTGVAILVTSFIKNAVAMASLQEAPRPLHEIAVDKTLDLSSESVIVVKTASKKLRKSKQASESSAESTPVAEVEPAAETISATPKKRTARPKKSSQEA